MQGWIINITLVFVCMSLLWAYAQRRDINSLVYNFWGSGFVLIAWASLIVRGAYRVYTNPTPKLFLKLF